MMAVRIEHSWAAWINDEQRVAVECQPVWGEPKKVVIRNIWALTNTPWASWKKGPPFGYSRGFCWGWNPTQLGWGLFHKPWNEDLYSTTQYFMESNLGTRFFFPWLIFAVVVEGLFCWGFCTDSFCHKVDGSPTFFGLSSNRSFFLGGCFASWLLGEKNEEKRYVFS